MLSRRWHGGTPDGRPWRRYPVDLFDISTLLPGFAESGAEQSWPKGYQAFGLMRGEKGSLAPPHRDPLCRGSYGIRV